MTDWFTKVPPRVSNSIIPVPQRLPIVFVRVAFFAAVTPLVVLVLWAWTY